MKKLTLLLVAAVMISGGSYAQSCCKKGGHCSKGSACCKDKKACDKAGASKEAKNAPNTGKAEPAKKSS